MRVREVHTPTQWGTRTTRCRGINTSTRYNNISTTICEVGEGKHSRYQHHALAGCINAFQTLQTYIPMHKVIVGSRTTNSTIASEINSYLLLQLVVSNRHQMVRSCDSCNCCCNCSCAIQLQGIDAAEIAAYSATFTFFFFVAGIRCCNRPSTLASFSFAGFLVGF